MAIRPFQFNKLPAITRFAEGRPWIWIDDPRVDLDHLPSRTEGTVIRTDPLRGLAGLDPALLEDLQNGYLRDQTPTLAFVRSQREHPGT